MKQTRITGLKESGKESGTLEVQSVNEAREILFAGRPELRDLFDKLEALPTEKLGPVIGVLCEYCTKTITPTETEQRLAEILRG